MGPSHVGVRCGAPAPEETDAAPNLAAPSLTLGKQVAAATNALLMLCSRPRPPAIETEKIAEKSAVDSERAGVHEEMNGRSGGGVGGGGVGEEIEMEEDGGAGCARGTGAGKERVVLMWGYLPGVSPQRSPLLGPVPVRLPQAAAGGGDGWRDVCGGGCGFAMAISESGKLLTWGSADDMGQSYVTAGKHEETPEAFPLPSGVAIVRADAGWAHCVAITDEGDVYTWGWKECVPTGRVIADQSSVGTLEKDERQSAIAADQVSPRSQASRTNSGAASGPSESKGIEDSTKRRRLSSAKQGPESSTSSDESLSAPPCVVTFNTGVKIVAVAAGGRHTLALSDLGQVWGWGYGGEGQLGLGSRIRTVSSPHPIPCIESAIYSKDRPSAMKGNKSAEGHINKVMGNCVKAIACGGRHSAVVTDSGALLTFGWGMYGQCGQGHTDDVLSPTCVSSILGVKMQDVATGLWHTVCTSIDGDVYSFGGNQFGQLGTGSDQAETVPKLVDATSLEHKNARSVSCGARHSAIITDEGEVFCWGWNKYGQLGLGDSMDRNVPCSVLVEAYHPLNVSCGWWHTLVLAESPT
ncbi:ultraviolet-B receptor UVR8-like isoform X2 [Phragmites australis]|uniref:ultraviolet-B receptor UVR8-like isoform X2 n=1 Tax=Phragmites australis TaxID=29695 RepID=UPI002D79D1C6|nr:ultraviolet-B receptor UVR8-like isoform X2 [Phragmites australis]